MVRFALAEPDVILLPLSLTGPYDSAEVGMYQKLADQLEVQRPAEQ